VNETFKRALIGIVGEANFSDDILDRVCYAYDASDHAHRPEAALWPVSREQITQILAFSSEHRIPVTPRGAGTSLTGAAVPVHGGVILDLCLMNQILDIRIADRRVVLQPGVIYADLERALAPHGFFFPPDPASSSVCTIGGNVATNAGGIRGAKYGVTRDYVLGLEVVLADGRVMRTGSYCIKSSSGYDLTRLLVGSEGTLGVITEILLRIQPRPTAVQTGLALFDSLQDAGQGVIAIMHSGVVPSVLEILDERSIQVVRGENGVSLPEVKAILLVETDGFTETEASFQMEKVIEVLKKHRAVEIRVARSPQEAEALWRVRRSIGSAAARLRPSNVSEDVTVPISRITDLLAGIAAIVGRHDLPFVVFGHAGDGNLHPRIMYDPADPDQTRRVQHAVGEIFRLTCDLGGTLTGEHGIGLAKAPYMGYEHDPVEMEMMRAIKRLFDPHHILNRGKMALDG
jgi:glycolate dehydrogenase FAD-linked subunit